MAPGNQTQVCIVGGIGGEPPTTGRSGVLLVLLTISSESPSCGWEETVVRCWFWWLRSTVFPRAEICAYARSPLLQPTRCRSLSANTDTTGSMQKLRVYWSGVGSATADGEQVTLSMHQVGGNSDENYQQCARRISELGSATTGQVVRVK